MRYCVLPYMVFFWVGFVNLLKLWNYIFGMDLVTLMGDKVRVFQSFKRGDYGFVYR